MHENKINQPEFGRKVRRFRQGRDQSQKALGEALGISQWTISRIEKGHTIRGLAVEKLCEEMGSSRGGDTTVSEIFRRIADSDELTALVRRVLEEERA